MKLVRAVHGRCREQHAMSDEAIIAKLRDAKAPIIAAINKCDIASADAIFAQQRKENCFRQIIEISAESEDKIGRMR